MRVNGGFGFVGFNGRAFEPYVVKKGDTLMNIMKNKNVSFEKLAKSNKSVRELTLPVGTVLLIDKEK